jgi:hypothetical protein
LLFFQLGERRAYLRRGIDGVDEGSVEVQEALFGPVDAGGGGAVERLYGCFNSVEPGVRAVRGFLQCSEGLADRLVLRAGVRSRQYLVPRGRLGLLGSFTVPGCFVPSSAEAQGTDVR